MAMAHRGAWRRSPAPHGGIAEPGVFSESEYSCPTSWEFSSVPLIPHSNNTIPEESEMIHFSSPLSSSTPISSFVLRMSGSLGSPEYLRGDGSGNSTGSHHSSSAESQKSHDSGFLDSIETRRRRSHGYPKISPSPPTTTILTPRRTCEEGHDSHSSIYQELILARSPIPPDAAILPSDTIFGTPASASTPLKITLPPSTNQLLKIDNFESLNKNLKSLDRNNNGRRRELNSKGREEESKGPRTQGQKITGSVSASEFRTQNGLIPPPRQFSAPSITTTHLARVGLNSREGAESSSQRPQEEKKREGYSNSNISKWVPLPRGFKRIAGSSFNASEDIVIKSHFDNEAVRLWLHELKSDAEPDCLLLLQTKSILGGRKLGRGQEVKSVSTPLISIRHIERVASYIAQEYSFLCKHLRSGFFGSVPDLVLGLLTSVEDFLKDLQEIYGQLEETESRLAHASYTLRLSILAYGNEEKSNSHPKGHSPPTKLEHCQLTLESPYSSSREELEEEFSPRGDYSKASTGRLAEKQTILIGEIGEGIMRIGSLFTQVTNQRLRNDLNCILDYIGDGGYLGRVSLQVLSRILVEGGSHMSKLAGSIRTVRVLLNVLIHTREDYDRLLCLRCLATILSIGEAVNDFDKAGGFEVIGDILADPSTGLELKYEGVGVLTQATDPWIDLASHTLTSLGRELEGLIYSLTRLIPYARQDEDNFLLTMAAISNLTFLELSSMEFLRKFKTIPLITSAVKTKSDFSVFVLDHVSTIFANMAGIESCRSEIVEHGGVQLLTQFLQSSPLRLDSLPEITACERLQQKSTIAISRLTNEDGVGVMVLGMGGIHRLVQLSRNDRERNYSDGVLIASLATLRKLVSICGDEIIRELEAEELIHPRLLDSFLLFSSRQESYV